MKAAVLHKNGDPTDPTVLSVEDNVDKPRLNDGEILVKVVAASINPVDWKLMQGVFPGSKIGGVTGLDVAGVVEEIGPGCDGTDLKVGDEVYADSAGSGGGSFAEYCKVQAIALSKKPKNCSFQQAAALPLTGLTALQGLEVHCGLKPGMKVCVMGGSSGVGSLAVQMAKAMGASHVYATGSSVEMIRSLGADTVINYKEQSIAEELEGKELDAVFDCVGGLEQWEAAKVGLKPGGRFVTIVGDGGSLSIAIASLLWRKLKALFGMSPSYGMFLTNTKAPEVVADMKKLTELVESDKVKPVLDGQTFELTTASMHEMIQASMSHRAKGKLILNVNSE